jgi:hypothetical protein
MWTLWITREKIIFITHIIILTRVGGHRHVQTRAPYSNGAVIANQAFCQDSRVRWRQGLPHAVDLPKHQVALEFASCKGRAAYVPCDSRSSPCKGQVAEAPIVLVCAMPTLSTHSPWPAIPLKLLLTIFPITNPLIPNTS